MKPPREEIIQACPEIDPRLVEEHLERLDERYFDSFSREEIVAHLKVLSKLDQDNPVEMLAADRGDGSFVCTVLAFDHPFEFSLITGVFAAMEFEISSGDIFTYRRTGAPAAEGAFRRRRAGLPAPIPPLKRRKIIDRFAGALLGPETTEAWGNEARSRLREVLGLLERGDRRSAEHARQRVNEMVAASLAKRRVGAGAALLPVEIEVGNNGAGLTRLRVVAQDTPFFLYALSVALSLRGVSIERVSIRTICDRIEDEFEIADTSGNRITHPRQLDQVRLSVLLTKQFTYFLGSAPDPYAALSRFENIVTSILDTPGRGGWIELLSDPRVMQDLARLLGASDFLWEDFIRQQYESLLPMLASDLKGKRLARDPGDFGGRLEAELAGASSFEEAVDRLNAFKDREIYLVDLDHILSPRDDFIDLSLRLTRLAEVVVNKASALVYDALVSRYGAPRTVAGMEVPYAALGLGKFGGEALGYASDIELMFVYSDSGETSGPQSVANAEFFGQLAQGVHRAVRAKREGIFHIDMRLRPYGQSGPWACSLESFCRYYGRGGAAHSYERLALVRLRAVGGDPRLGERVERIRSEIVYGSRSIDLQELRDLRERQLVEKTQPGKLNAKFSPGALVDLEYAVQMLQVTHARRWPELKTPSIHAALAALAKEGVLAREESESLVAAYHFLRRLINGLRMLRGSAQDLFLPESGSDEYAHLARRMGYEGQDSISPAQQLHAEFETRTAVVRAFVERHFGRASLPGPAVGNVADLVLSDTVPEELRGRILREAGFDNVERAYVNLRALAGQGRRREMFAQLAVLACDILAHMPDPDRALNNWERFAKARGRAEEHCARLLAQPTRLEILLAIFASSQFLAETLARNPEFMEWATAPESLRRVREREEMEADLWGACRGEDWRDHMRRLRRRETLRIGTRDICLNMPLREITVELSHLADACVSVALDRVLDELSGKAGREAIQAMKTRFCVLAFGKLGGEELNYSSDIDLVGVCDTAGLGAEAPGLLEQCAMLMERVRSSLSGHSAEGHAYRVDLRLRPHGRSGPLVPSMERFLRYYRQDASLWEVQSLLKVRRVAGAEEAGRAIEQGARRILARPRERKEVAPAIERMRRLALRGRASRRSSATDVKTGLGGIRDIEFLVQGLQLIHAGRSEGLLARSTLQALEALRSEGALPADAANRLRRDYVFLRRVEHSLQVFEDRQVHALPKPGKEMTALARRMLGMEASAEMFGAELGACLKRVREAYRRFLLEGG